MALPSVLPAVPVFGPPSMMAYLEAIKNWIDYHNAPNVAVTATSDGAGTGTIPANAKHVSVTSASADNIVKLPAPVVGWSAWLDVGANGCELRSTSPTTIAINGGTGADAESAIPANSTVLVVCIGLLAFKAIKLDADSDVAKVEAAA